MQQIPHAINNNGALNKNVYTVTVRIVFVDSRLRDFHAAEPIRRLNGYYAGGSLLGSNVGRFNLARLTGAECMCLPERSFPRHIPQAPRFLLATFPVFHSPMSIRRKEMGRGPCRRGEKAFRFAALRAQVEEMPLQLQLLQLDWATAGNA